MINHNNILVLWRRNVDLSSHPSISITISYFLVASTVLTEIHQQPTITFHSKNSKKTIKQSSPRTNLSVTRLFFWVHVNIIGTSDDHCVSLIASKCKALAGTCTCMYVPTEHEITTYIKSMVTVIYILLVLLRLRVRNSGNSCLSH